MTLEALRSAATGSGTDTWSNCPASVALALHLPEREPEEYSLDGDWAHDKSAKVYLLTGKELPENEDEAIQVYVSTIRRVAGPHAKLYVEERLPLLGTTGQIDCYSVNGKTAYLFDFKYGVGKKLQAHGNGQLAFYACAIKERHPEVTRVLCYLIQPRVDDLFDDTPAVTTWLLTWQGLASWKKRIAEALDEVEKASRMRAGPWCQFCQVKGGCPAHMAHVAVALARQQEIAEIKVDWTPTNIPKIAKMLTLKKPVETFFKKAEEFLLAQKLAGQKIIDEAGRELFELGQKRSNRRWIEMFPEEEVAEDLERAGIPKEKIFIKEMISPAAAEKLIGKKKVASIANLWEKPEGGPRLRLAGNNDEED